MLMHRRLIPLLALLFALVSISADCCAAAISVKEDVIELRGEIVMGDADRFIQSASVGIRTVRVGSQGGSLDEALRIGQTILARGLEIEVAGLCASACAQLILPAGKTVRLDDGSVVALHAAAHGAYLAARREGRIPALRPDLYTKALDELAKLDHDMLAFLEASGVRAEQIEFMYALTSTSDVQVIFDDAGNGKGDLRLTGSKNPICRAWLLDSQALKSLGIRSSEWRASGRFKASLILGEKYDQIYDGQVVPLANLSNDIDCAALRAGRVSVFRPAQ